MLKYNTTNKGSRPEIQDDPGARGRGKEKSRRSSTPPTRDSAPCRRRTSVEINFRREMVTSENETTRCSRGGTTAKPDQGIVLLDASHKNTEQKDGWQWTTQMIPKIG